MNFINVCYNLSDSKKMSVDANFYVWIVWRKQIDVLKCILWWHPLHWVWRFPVSKVQLQATEHFLKTEVLRHFQSSKIIIKNSLISLNMWIQPNFSNTPPRFKIKISSAEKSDIFNLNPFNKSNQQIYCQMFQILIFYTACCSCKALQVTKTHTNTHTMMSGKWIKSR